jgi:hypothetical protein
MDEHYKQIIPPKMLSPSARHRKQRLWQIWVPLIASMIIVLALVIWSIVGAVQGSSQIERFGNLAAVWVIMPVLFSGFIMLVLVAGVAFGVIWLHRKMPGWMLKAQLFMLRVALTTRRAADRATQPVFAVNSVSSRAGTLWNKIFRRRPASRI